MSVRRETDAQTKLAIALTGVMNSFSGLMGVVILVGLALVIYLFSGIIGMVLSVTAQVVGAVLLLVLGFVYVCDALDEPNQSLEDIALGMSMYDFILEKYRDGELKATKILRKTVKANMTDEESSEASFRKQTLGLLYTHGALTVLMIVYAVCGFAPFLGFLAVVAGSFVTLMTCGLYAGLDMLKSKPLPVRTMRTRIIYWLSYGLPPLYVLVILLSYIF